MNCALCEREAREGSRLCSNCNISRLNSASLARIMGGGGLTWSNVNTYSEENWIKAILDDRKVAGQ